MPELPAKLNTTYISDVLSEKLSHIVEYPITTIVAPIGYGKTRAINWWAEQCQAQLPDAMILRQVIITDSLTDLWRGFCRNLRPWPALKAEMEALHVPTDPQSRAVMLELLCDALASGGHEIFYILDDLHFLQAPDFTALLLFLGQRLPNHVHLILLSRNIIFQQTNRLHLGARLWELDTDDLRLNKAGIRAYAQHSGLALNQEAAAHLEKTTEGWFSMVYLSLRIHQQQGRWPDSTSSIYPLIDETLFHPIPPRQQAFLVQLGVPDDFTVEEAAFLWPDSDAAALLKGLTEQNAFITCTDGIYRYHNMLRSCAREKFALLSKDVQAATHTRLGQWYEKTADYVRAAEYYEKAAAWEPLLCVVEQDRGLSFGPESLPTVRRWMTQCPEAIQLRHPQALLVFMLLLFYAHDIPEIHRYYALFQRSMALCTELSKRERDQLEGEALLRLSFLRFNDISAMSAYHRKIHALIPADRNPWTQGSPSVLMLYHSQSGHLDQENAEMQACMPIYSQISGGHGSGAATLMQAETEFVRGNLADAAILCHRAEQQAMEAHEYSIYTASVFLAARLAQYEQPPQNGLFQLDRAADTLRKARQYRLLTTIELSRGWLCALQGQIEQLPAWLTTESSMTQVFPLIKPIFQTIVGRVLLERGQWAQVAARTPQQLQSNSPAQFALCSLYAHLQIAVALQHLGKTADAQTALHNAWTLAQADGILLPFAESDPCLDALLAAQLDCNIPPQLHMLRTRFRAGRKTHAVSASCLAQYGLTERELEIATLAAQRKSSREIAEALCVSVKSVNNRLNTVYEKLGFGGEGRNKRQALIEFMKYPPH